MARACACFILLRALLLQQLQLPLVSETYPGYDLDNWGLQWDPPPDPRPASVLRVVWAVQWLLADVHDRGRNYERPRKRYTRCMGRVFEGQLYAREHLPPPGRSWATAPSLSVLEPPGAGASNVGASA